MSVGNPYIDPGNAGGGGVIIPDTTHTGSYGVAPIIFTCEYCGKKFIGTENEKLFYQHQDKEHPIVKPRFFIKNEELTASKKSIYQKLQGNDIEIKNCTKILVNDKRKTINQLNKLLANQSNEFFKIELSNERYSNPDSYEIEFFVSSNEILDAIDDLFLVHFSKQILTMEKLNSFIHSIKSYRNTQTENFIDAYVSYLYGVLAKEQNQEIQTTFSEYQDRFNKSTETLKHYQTRKLTRSICAVSLFNLNHFDSAESLADSLPNVLNACRFIKYGELAQTHDNEIPVDWITATIIELLVISSDNLEKLVEAEEKLLKSGFVPETDKYKIIVILARKYTQSNHHEKAATLLKKIRNNPDFEQILNNISEIKNG
jgi:hypothetical protein